MLGLNSLGVVAGLLRDPRPFPLTPALVLTTLTMLSLPLLPLALLAYVRSARLPREATLGGVLAALSGAVCSYVLLEPESNRDANIGMGLYFIFGVIFPLGAAYVIGLILGQSWRGSGREQGENNPRSPLTGELTSSASFLVEHDGVGVRRVRRLVALGPHSQDGRDDQGQ